MEIVVEDILATEDFGRIEVIVSGKQWGSFDDFLKSRQHRSPFICIKAEAY